jgi:hypothetical protein
MSWPPPRSVVASFVVPAVVLKDSASIRLYASRVGAGGAVVGGTVVVGTVVGGIVVVGTVVVVVVGGGGAVNESQFKLVKSAG